MAWPFCFSSDVPVWHGTQPSIIAEAYEPSRVDESWVSGSLAGDGTYFSDRLAGQNTTEFGTTSLDGVDRFTDGSLELLAGLAAKNDTARRSNLAMTCNKKRWRYNLHLGVLRTNCFSKTIDLAAGDRYHSPTPCQNFSAARLFRAAIDSGYPRRPSNLRCVDQTACCI